ncbi:MAG: 3-phosphoshikimate 1-carboxyvinyltransferase [Solobacterium sp.]|nr:3-phosphoshikimate 1-carboxyvinyltransferase [Solobacterium sp.]
MEREEGSVKVTILPGLRKEPQPVRIPGSKSISHRALIAASLAQEPSVIRGLVNNADTMATVNCLKQFGARFEPMEDGALKVHGFPGKFLYDGSIVDCGESGSTLRFLIPLFSMGKQEVVFTGHGRLMSRPQTVYEDLFRKRGLKFEQKGELLYVKGPLSPGDYAVKGNVSSQFISGLLFALPLVNGDTSIVVKEPYESRSYVGLTIDMLEEAGILIREEKNILYVPGGQRAHGLNTSVAGDDSQAAFFAVLAMCAGTAVPVSNLRHASRQGDHVMISLFEQAGGRSVETADGYRFEPGEARAFEADLADCPDLGPALFALASICPGTSVFHHCARLRIKESDRVACMKQELEALGVSVRIRDEDTVEIDGCSTLKGGVTLHGHNDHRIVMALSVLAAACQEPLTIEGAEAVRKSYPGFFEDLRKAGAEVQV